MAISNAGLTPADITPGAVVTNGKGRFRLVTNTRKVGAFRGADYIAAYVNTKGQMRPSPARGGHCGVYTLAAWATRLATPEERAEVVRCLNPKGIE